MAKKNEKIRMLIVEDAEKGSGFVEMKVGTAEKARNKAGYKNFTNRINFYFLSKEGVEAFIKDLRKQADKAFKK